MLKEIILNDDKNLLVTEKNIKTIADAEKLQAVSIFNKDELEFGCLDMECGIHEYNLLWNRRCGYNRVAIALVNDNNDIETYYLCLHGLDAEIWVRNTLFEWFENRKSKDKHYKEYTLDKLEGFICSLLERFARGCELVTTVYNDPEENYLQFEIEGGALDGVRIEFYFDDFDTEGYFGHTLEDIVIL